MKLIKAFFLLCVATVTLLAQTQIYVATLNQTGDDNTVPVAHVLESTFPADPLWAFDDPGRYYISNIVFPCARTFLYINTFAEVGTPWDRQAGLWCDAGGTVHLNTGNMWENSSGVLNNTPMEIRIYPAPHSRERKPSR